MTTSQKKKSRAQAGAKRLLPFVALVFSGIAPLGADGIRESNYLHIDPSTAITLNGFVLAERIGGRVIDADRVQVGTAFGDLSHGDLSLSLTPQNSDSVAFLFDEDICAFGFQIRLPSREQGNSIPVEMRFIARDGRVVDALRRQPALGTTRQAYSSDGFTHRFAGVMISTQTIGEMAIGEIRALPCLLAIS